MKGGNSETHRRFILRSLALAYFVNKGGIPYGEHEPSCDSHGSNGKDPMCAVLFGLQPGRTVETEYYTRMSVAGFTDREYGHTGQGFSYLWGAMGANMGGSLSRAKTPLPPIRSMPPRWPTQWPPPRSPTP